MVRSRRIDEIFEECLERVFSGEPVEQCVNRFPEHATELRGLLETAIAARKAAAVEPSPEFRARARIQLQDALRERGPVQVQRRRAFSWGWQPRWAVALTAFLILLVGGSSTVLASNNSMPGQPLYVVKQATERAKLAVTNSPTAKAELYAGLAERRVNEIVYLAANGGPESLEKVTRELDNCLTNISELSGGVGEKAVLSARNSPDENGLMSGTGQAIDMQGESPTGLTPPSVTQIPPTSEPMMSTTNTNLPVTAGDSSKAAVSTQESFSPLYSNDVTITDNRLLNLRARVYYQAAEYPALLKAALANARPETRLALLQAIAVSETGYEMVLQSLNNAR